jgi:hypothetical protein
LIVKSPDHEYKATPLFQTPLQEEKSLMCGSIRYSNKFLARPEIIFVITYKLNVYDH